MPQPDGRHAIAVLLCTTAVAARMLVGPHITDDAYITMRYSRNLSVSGVMSYNPPDAVLGTSTPLWTWILAAGSGAGIAPETTAIATASAADLASIVVLLTLPAEYSLAALGAATTIAAWPAYVTFAVSGMETSLYVLTIIGFVAALSRQQVLLASVAASLGVLCRPDGALLVVLGFAWLMAGESRRSALRFMAGTAALCGPWVLYAVMRFGSVIPASVRAKAAAVDPWFTSLQNLEAYFLRGAYLPLTLLAVTGFVLIASNRSGIPVFWRVWWAWAWIYLAAMTALNAFTHFPWYFVPLLPIYIASATIAVERAARHLARRAWQRPGANHHVFGTRAFRPAAQATVAVVVGAFLLTRMVPLKAYLDEAANGRETLYASVAQQLAATDPRCTIAATEIGTIGYHYPGRVLDLVGLVSPEVVGRPVDDVLGASGARWLVTYDTHFDRSVAASDRFSTLFERSATLRVSDARSLEIYERRARAACGER